MRQRRAEITQQRGGKSQRDRDEMSEDGAKKKKDSSHEYRFFSTEREK